MNKPSTLRQTVSWFVAPIAVIVITYAVVFQTPLERQLAQRVTKLHKLEEVFERRKAKSAVETERLAELRAAERALTHELENSKQVGAKLVTQRAYRRAELFHTTSPASLVAQTLELLARHELECLDSSPAAPTASSAASLEALGPIAELLGGTKDQEACRREVRIKLAGRFEDIQASVREIHAALPDIFIVSLEMEVADGHTDRRTWLLTISV